MITPPPASTGKPSSRAKKMGIGIATLLLSSAMVSACGPETVKRTVTPTTTATTTKTSPAPAANAAISGFIGGGAVAPGPALTPYSSCAEARAAGAAPLYRGTPGYNSSLDRDGDGVACE